MLLNDFSDEQLFCSFIAEEQERNRAIANMVGIKTAVDFFKSCGIACSTKTSLHKIKKVFQETDIADIYIGNLRLDVRLSLDPNEFYIPKKHYELGITPDLYMLVYYDKVASKTSVVGFITPKEVDKSASDNYYYFVSKSVIASFEETAQLFDTAPATENEAPLNIKKKILLYIDNQLSDINGFYQEIASSKKARELFIEALYAEKLLSATEFKFEYSEEVISTSSNNGKEELYDLGFADGLMASELTASIVEADKSETIESSDEVNTNTIDLEDFITVEEPPIKIEDNAITTARFIEEQFSHEETQEPLSEPEKVIEPQEEIENNAVESIEEQVDEVETTDSTDSTEFDLDNFTDDESEETTIEVSEELQTIESPEADTGIEVVESIESELAESSDIESSEESSVSTTENSLELDTEFSLTEDVSTENDVTEELQLVDTVPASADLDIETSSEEELEFSLSIEEPATYAPEEGQETATLDLINEEETEQSYDELDSLSLDSTEELLDVTPLEDSIDFPEEGEEETVAIDATEEETPIVDSETFAFTQNDESNSVEDFSLEDTEPITLEDSVEEELGIPEFSLEAPQELSFETLEDEDEMVQEEPANLELGFENSNELIEEPLSLEDSIEDIELEDVDDIKLEEPTLDFVQETEPTTLENEENNDGLSFNEFAEDIKVIDENSITPENTSQDEEDNDDEEEEENRFDKYDNLDENYVPDFASGEFSLAGTTPESEEAEREVENTDVNAVEPLDIQATMEGFVNSMAPADSLNLVNKPEQAESDDNSELQIIAENDDSLIEAIAEDVAVEESGTAEETLVDPAIESGTMEAIDSLYEEDVPVEEEAHKSIPHKKATQKSNGLSFIIVLLSIIAISAATWFNKDIIMDKLGGFSQSSTDSVPNELATPVEAKNTQQVKEQKHKVKTQKKTEAEELLNDVEEPVQLIDTSVSVSQLSIDCDVPSVLVTTYSKRYLIKLAKRTQLQLRNALLLANGQPLANKIVIDLSVNNDIVKFEKISSSSGSKKVDAITKATIEEILKDTQPHIGTFGKIGGNVRLIVKF